MRSFFKIFFCTLVALLLSAESSHAWKQSDSVASTSRPTAAHVDVRGGGYIPAGWHPYGYKITELGEEYLAFEGSLDSDLGRFLASLKTKRKTVESLKDNWVEVVKVTKSAQSMRILRKLYEYIEFCLKAGLID